MATDDELKAAGFALPQGSDLIRHGDDAIRKNANAAYEFSKKNAGIQTKSISGNVDLNSLTETQEVIITSSNGVFNSPINQIGKLSVRFASNIVVQDFQTLIYKTPLLFTRTRTSAGTWQDWKLVSSVGQTFTPDVSFDEMLKFGTYPIGFSSHGSIPTAAIGTLEVLPAGNGWLQRYTTWQQPPITYVRRATNLTGDSWGPWEKLAMDADLRSLRSQIQESKKPTSTTGNKVVPIAITCPGTPLTEQTSGGVVRWERVYYHTPRRIKVHVKNANAANSSSGSNLSLTGIWVGRGDGNGNLNGAVKASTESETIGGNATDLVTGWVDTSFIPDGEPLSISVGWNGSGTIQKNQGGGWVSNTADVNSQSSTGFTFAKETPFHIWIEAEVPGMAPVILGHGDSITVGTATASPVADSWVSQLAFELGAIPVILAQHGSKMTNWGSGSPRWKLFGDFDISSVADVVVTTLGQNDLAESGITLSTLTARNESVVNALNELFPHQPLFYGAITPSNKSSAVEIVRRQFNEYRKELPLLARGYLDFATAVGGSEDENLLSKYNADGLHPNSAGQAAMKDVAKSAKIAPSYLPR